MIGIWPYHRSGRATGSEVHHGGTVLIGSRATEDSPVRKRRVGVHPVFDPLAITMTPIRGWTVAKDGNSFRLADDLMTFVYEQ